MHRQSLGSPAALSISSSLSLSTPIMHRQSLGSPASKLHSHGGIEAVEEKDEADQVCRLTNNEEDNNKSQKAHKSPSRSESYKFIHLIPILTVICFLILYLSSHNPSQNDLAQFNGLKRSSELIDIDDVGRFLEIKKGGVLAIRGLRKLQEISRYGPANRRHRKISNF
ncbi:uncharacterized protein LOC132302271 isoform X2 [Cornus florida]|uniref:uncharacterized protein LOC132302271 isoform X2 n=1 Tax=Cornus florida TaxID=4283 RepID=UPI00289771D6|nr:uncharacterized protein LOC132302271 isoform X2 [Cornus florida]